MAKWALHYQDDQDVNKFSFSENIGEVINTELI